MATYYVDSTVGGPGAGTIGDPWGPTINNILTNLGPGDILLVRGGANKAAKQSYTETIAITNANGCVHGTAVNPITIRNFATEFITFDQAADADTFAVDRDYWVLDGTGVDGGGNYYFEIDKGGGGDFGINLDADNFTASYVELHDGSEFMIDVNGDDCLIEYCTIYDMQAGPHVDAHGILIRGTSSNGVVDNCEMYDCSGNCIQIFDDDVNKGGWEFSNNEFYVSVPGPGFDSLFGAKAGHTVIFRDNVLHGARDNDGAIGGTSGDGRPLIIRTLCYGWEVYGNTFYDNSGSIELRHDNSGAWHTFRNNVIRDPTFEAAIAEKTMVYFTIDPHVYFYNNTIVGSLGAGTNVMRFLASAHVVLRNNIFKDTEEIQDASAALTYSNNCWRNTTHTLAGAGDISGDPLFTNEGADDFTLQAGSPCRDAGADVGLPYQGTDPDMGAFEYIMGGGAVVHVTTIVTVVVAVQV